MTQIKLLTKVKVTLDEIITNFNLEKRVWKQRSSLI